jgi:hypothetical protein
MVADPRQQDQAAGSADEPATADQRPGAPAVFPYDRTTIERFRETFPRARWREDLNAWFVPGTTAEKRISRWLAGELSGSFAYADERGRDAFEFDPIESSYLEAGADMRIVTPYSRTIVGALRKVPWARWDPDTKAWRVPYRSLEQLKKHWPAIEAAARRNEPEERLKRRKAKSGTHAQEHAKAVARERRRHRYPVPLEAIPPIGRVLMTPDCGAVIFTDVTTQLAEISVRDEYYAGVGRESEDLIWANWRSPTLSELVKTWPAKHAPAGSEVARGWWQPSLQELRHERRRARSIERALETRRGKRKRSS